MMEVGETWHDRFKRMVTAKDFKGALGMLRARVGLDGRRVGDLIANAYYEGFVEATKHQPWDDMFDWAALKGQQHAREVIARAAKARVGEAP